MKDHFKLDFLYNKYRENKNSHVYLVETNSIDNAVEDIKELLIKINEDQSGEIDKLINSDNLPTLSIIKPQQQEIIKDDIEKLIINLQRIPVITKENYFIICEAERLNHKSGNQMLKIIEEPETDILGFFICLNSDNVMPTIQSRTQLINLKYDIKSSYDEDVISDAKKYFKEYHNKTNIFINKYYVDKYKDNKLMNQFIECLINEENKYISSLNKFDIIKKENLILELLFKLQKAINNNCNSNLELDKFIIEVNKL